MLNEKIVSDLAEKLGLPEVLEQFRSTETPADGVNPFAEKLGLVETFSAEQLTARLTNERQIAAAEATRTATGNTYGAIDSRVLKATGIPKNEGERTDDYTERAFKEKFGKSGGDENAELTRLRADIAAKDQLLTQKDTELQQVQVRYATEAKQTQINARLDAAINTLPINTTPELLDSQREFVKYRLSQKYDIDVVEGKEQFTDKVTKEVKRDSKTAAPMTAAVLVAEFAPTVVSLKKQSVTTGSGFQGSGNDFNKEDDAATFDFTKYTSLKEFAEDLNKQGIPSGSDKGGKVYAAFKKARPDLK
ncbi:hypothetical protein [Hymenobacter guriensis]|uniref:Coil containing protein n=1 Tax=Hymenobacter guriensis TaxID=2793065 RepID=A0ABS0L7Q9_9BACT|nr:hypothetical protein [Hymenobacter guriensis]MBG8556166.1 hypothetical protein [Hymenobacter guriensis]